MSAARSRSGGHRDLQDVHAIETILAELLVRDNRRRSLCDARDDADVDLDGLGAADRASACPLAARAELDLRIDVASGIRAAPSPTVAAPVFTAARGTSRGTVARNSRALDQVNAPARAARGAR